MEVFSSKKSKVSQSISTSDRLLISVKVAAEKLSVSERTCQSMISLGTIPSVKVGKRRLIKVDDLVGYVNGLGA